MVLLAAAPMSTRAERAAWNKAVSGSFDEGQRWDIGSGVVSGHRVPNSGDDVLIAASAPITISVSGSPSVKSAVVGGEITLDLASDFTVAETFLGSPVLTGAGTLRAAHWRVDGGAPFALLRGVKAEVKSFGLPGFNGFGLHISSGGKLKAEQYVEERLGFGKRALIVEGAGSEWSMSGDLNLDREMEIAIRKGGLVTLGKVLRTGSFLLDEGGKLSAERFDPWHVSARNGASLATGDSTPLGKGLSLGYGAPEINASTWSVAGKLTLTGFTSTLKIAGGGFVQTGDLDILDSAELQVGDREVVGEEDYDGTLKVANVLRKEKGTLRLRGGEVDCGSLDLRFDGRLQGQRGVEGSGLIAARGKAAINAPVTLEGAILADDIVVGEGERDRGSVELRGGGLLGRKSVVVGAEGGGSVMVDSGALMFVDSPSIILGEGKSGIGLLEIFRSPVTPWKPEGRIVIGEQGQGTLHVKDAELEARPTAGFTLATKPGSKGALRVSGPEGSVSLYPFRATPLVVGEQGQGTLAVEAGAKLQAGDIVIGRSSEDNVCSVEGPPPEEVPEPNLSASEMIIGGPGRGSLRVASGGHARAALATVGRNSMADNRVDVADGCLFRGSNLSVGSQGRGTLETRGSVDFPHVALAKEDRSEAVVRVRGEDASFSVARFLDVGGGQLSKASMSLLEGGEARAAALYALVPATGSAEIVVDGLGSELVVDTKMQLGRLGRASGPIAWTISGGGYGRVGQELLIRRETRVTVGGGSVIVGQGNQPAPGNLLVASGGTLKGDGRIKAAVVAAGLGGRVAPGAALGTLTVEGEAQLAAGSVLELEISGPTAPQGHDFLRVTGKATISGLVELRFINGYAPKAGQRYCFVQADGGLTFSPSAFTVSGLAEGFAHELTIEGDGQLCLTAKANGVPATEPEVKVERNGDKVDVTWTAPPDVFTLETAEDLQGPWTPVPATGADAGQGGFSHQSDASGQGFFRLRW